MFFGICCLSVLGIGFGLSGKVSSPGSVDGDAGLDAGGWLLLATLCCLICLTNSPIKTPMAMVRIAVEIKVETNLRFRFFCNARANL